MPPPLKVLVIHNDYQQAGGETFAVETQKAVLRARGHAVVEYGRDNREIEGFTVAGKAAALAQAVYSSRTYREVRALVEREQPAIAHVHNVFPLVSPSAYAALHDARVPIVQGVHNYRFMCPNGFFYTHGEVCERCKGGNTVHAIRWRCYHDSYALSGVYALAIGSHRARGTFGLIARFVVPAAFAGAKLVESGVATDDRVAVVDYCLPDLPAPGSFDERPPHVVFMGRLSDEKGLWTLIDAMQDLPSLTLTIYGTGPLEAPIRERLQSERSPNVRLGGFVSGEAKLNAIRSARAVVVPSRWYDVAPFSMIESLAAATPVVVPRHGDFPNVIADREHGLLFAPSSSADLRRALAWLADHPAEAAAMARRARAQAEARYTTDAYYRRLLDVYEAVA